MYDVLIGGSDPVFEALAPYLSQRGVPCRLRPMEHFRVSRGFWRRDLRWNPLGPIVQHRASGHFAVADMDDWSDPRMYGMETVLLDPRCRVYLKAQYRPSAYNDRRYRHKVRPWTYFEMHPLPTQRLLARLRGMERTREKLFFRGKIEHARRDKILAALGRQQILNPSQEPIGLGLYFRQLSKHCLALGLPGNGGFCHREIEAFGIGTPVLMPVLENCTHEPLVPDHHYVCVDVNARTALPELIAARIGERYRQVVDDRAWLAKIARQAMAWYDRNVRLPAAVELTARLLGLWPASAASRATWGLGP